MAQPKVAACIPHGPWVESQLGYVPCSSLLNASQEADSPEAKGPNNNSWFPYGPLLATGPLQWVGVNQWVEDADPGTLPFNYVINKILRNICF